MNQNQTFPAPDHDSRHRPVRAFPLRRILVVDDDTDIRELSASALGYSGYQVDTAEDGAAAWTALQSASYDLLITDNNMPEVSGVELLKKLRAARMEMLVIMATGTLPKELCQESLLRPAAVLLKPYSILELVGTVQKVLHSNEGTGKATSRPNLPNPPQVDVQSCSKIKVHPLTSHTSYETQPQS
jgi:DNA-binding response OmpR family regulator